MKKTRKRNPNRTTAPKPVVLLYDHVPKMPDADYTYLLYIAASGCSAPTPEGDLILQPGDCLLFYGSAPLPLRLPGRRPPSARSDAPAIRSLAFRSDQASELFTFLLLEQNPIARFLMSMPDARRTDGCLIVRTGDDGCVPDYLSRIACEIATRQRYHELMESHYVSLLMAHLIRVHDGHCLRQIDAPFSQEGYRIMHQIIRSDFTLTLNDVAASLHVAPSYASEYVHKATGMHFSRLMLAARDYVACRTLLTTAKSIRAISDQTGYSNPENFVRAFKKLHGCTPTQYREKHA